MIFPKSLMYLIFYFNCPYSWGTHESKDLLPFPTIVFSWLEYNCKFGAIEIVCICVCVWVSMCVFQCRLWRGIKLIDSKMLKCISWDNKKLKSRARALGSSSIFLRFFFVFSHGLGFSSYCFQFECSSSRHCI